MEEVFENKPLFRFIERSDIEGENLHAAFGRTDAGRYLTVYFVHKTTHEALVINSRDMTKKERRRYGKK